MECLARADIGTRKQQQGRVAPLIQPLILSLLSLLLLFLLPLPVTASHEQARNCSDLPLERVIPAL
jgi:hypothetical protein